MFFTYRQNNSGGVFTNPAQFVIIEADNSDEANRIAQDIGLYWDGCYTGTDCSCCGDRWRECDDENAKKRPLIYSQSPQEYMKEAHDWDNKYPVILIVYKDGKKDKYYYAKTK